MNAFIIPDAFITIKLANSFDWLSFLPKLLSKNLTTPTALIVILLLLLLFFETTIVFLTVVASSISCEFGLSFTHSIIFISSSQNHDTAIKISSLFIIFEIAKE